MSVTDRAISLNKDTVPPKEELVSMTKDEMDILVKNIEEKYAKKFEEAMDSVERLRTSLEKDSELQYVKNRGQFADSDIEIRQLGPLGPVDHQMGVIKSSGVEDKLKGKQARFVNNNPELRALRRHQGYEPVLDKDGNEVRYMDGTLMAMPEERYKETIVKPRTQRKALHKRSLRTRFDETARKAGIETFGDGIQYDRGDV